MFNRGLHRFEKAFKLPVRRKKRDDPVPVCPEVGSTVVDLRRRTLYLIKFAAKEIKHHPHSVRSWVHSFKLFEGRMHHAKFPDAIGLILAEFSQHTAPAIGIYLETVEEQVEFEQTGEQDLSVLKEIDLLRVIRETGLAKILFDALPIIRRDMIASIG